MPLVRDVLAAYAAYRDRTLPFWDPLPIQYADYALWDHESETALESVHHWQSALSRGHHGIALDSRSPGLGWAARGGPRVVFTVRPDDGGRGEMG